MARLLVNGEQYFTDNNGAPLAGGKVYFYIPNTSTFKDTWQDAGESILNTNPITLDAAGRAIIWGDGEYRQVVRDADGNLIWDQVTSTAFATNDGGVLWGETSSGSPNAQTITTTTTFDNLEGKIVCFFAGFSNTGNMSLTVNTEDPIFLVKDTNAGPSPLVGGEVVQGNLILVMWDQENNIFHLVNGVPIDLVLRYLQVNRLSFGNSISPAALEENTDDWNPTSLNTTSNVRVSSTTAIRLTGIAAQSPGRQIFLDNVGNFGITLSVNDTDSVSANRFLGPADIVLRGGQSAILKYDNTGGGWRIYQLVPAAILSMMGLYIRNGSTADEEARITVTRIALSDADGSGVMLYSVDVTCDITASGANGLDTGAVAANTGYYVWLIYNPSTNVVAGLFSLSATAPTMPTGYTFKARVGWFRTDGSSDLKRIIQKGTIARYVVDASHALPIIATGASGLAAVTVVGTLPPTAPIITLLLQTRQDNYSNVAPNGDWDDGTLVTSGKAPWTATFAGVIEANILLESTDVYYAAGSEGGLLEVAGWIDDIG